MKTQLHRLIEETDDETLLAEWVEQLEQTKQEDWWEALSPAQQARLHQSELQHQEGRVVSNEVVLDKIRQWLQK